MLLRESIELNIREYMGLAETLVREGANKFLI